MRPSTARCYGGWISAAVSRGMPWPPTTEDVQRMARDGISAGLAYQTIRATVAAIRCGLRGELEGYRSAAPFDEQAIRAEMSRLRREALPGRGQAAPLRRSVLVEAVSEATAEERALLLVGWAGMMRPGELVAMRWGDVREVPEGLEITTSIKRETPRIVYVPRSERRDLCPAEAMAAWRPWSPPALSLVWPGRDGRHGPSWVRDVIRRCLGRVGVDAGRYTGHSLRRGAATEARLAGAGMDQIRDQLGHALLETTTRYVETVHGWERCPTARLLDAAVG